MTRSLSAAVLVCALCVLSACGGSGTGGGSQVVTHLAVTAPASASAGTPFSITVIALDSSNKTVSGYSGTVHLTSSDPLAVLPGDSTLPNGTKNFSVTLENAGSQTITATDTVSAAITGSSNSIEVSTSTSLHGFQATGDMGTERATHTATLLQDGKVLITGGFNNTEVLATAELFDPATGTFTPTGAMTTVRFSHTATLLADGKVLITGGSDNLAALAFHDSQPATLYAKGEAHAADGSISLYDVARSCQSAHHRGIRQFGLSRIPRLATSHLACQRRSACRRRIHQFVRSRDRGAIRSFDWNLHGHRLNERGAVGAYRHIARRRQGAGGGRNRGQRCGNIRSRYRAVHRHGRFSSGRSMGMHCDFAAGRDSADCR